MSTQKKSRLWTLHCCNLCGTSGGRLFSDSLNSFSLSETKQIWYQVVSRYLKVSPDICHFMSSCWFCYNQRYFKCLTHSVEEARLTSVIPSRLITQVTPDRGRFYLDGTRSGNKGAVVTKPPFPKPSIKVFHGSFLNLYSTYLRANTSCSGLPQSAFFTLILSKPCAFMF